MAGKRLALVIAASKYNDPDLKKLNSPAQDAKTLGDILRDIKIGRFDEVKVLQDQPSYEIRGQIEEFFGDRSRDDLLLLYFSCHGIKDDEGQLHFATSDTYRKRLHSTAVSAGWVNGIMNRSRSKRQVLLLDCCYSGAFAKGMVAKAGDKEMHTKEHFDGHGRIILTASDSMQYSFEGDDLKEVGAPAADLSVFTQAIVQGLKTGEADRNKDGHISSDELYEYTFEKVTNKTPLQKPSKWTLGVEGDIIIAHSTKTTAAGIVSLWWKELRNQQFLEKIRRQDCIPFIGLEACKPWIPAANVIANQWAQAYRYPFRLTDLPDQLPRVAQFLAIKEGGRQVPKDLLSHELGRIVAPDFHLDQFRDTPPAVLADLNLPIYITTNYDHFIEEALKSRGKEPISDFCRWSEDLVDYANEKEINPEIYKEMSDYKPTNAYPLVYHLHGDIDYPFSMVLTKEDYDNFVLFLNREEFSRRVLPLVIRREIISKPLLLIGYTIDEPMPLDLSVIFQTVITSGRDRGKKGIIVSGNTNIRDEVVKKYLEDYTNQILNLNVYWGDSFSFSIDLRKEMESF
ncbi:MAG: SIR2 family protein [Candidatus Nitrosopolaris sp.]